MFNSTIEFDQAIYTLLKGIHDGTQFDEIKEKVGDNFIYALEECINRGYIKGANVQGTQFSIGIPRLTYEGLRRYETK